MPGQRGLILTLNRCLRSLKTIPFRVSLEGFQIRVKHFHFASVRIGAVLVSRWPVTNERQMALVLPTTRDMTLMCKIGGSMELTQLIEDLSNPSAYPFGVQVIEVHHTHISVVFLA